MTTPTVGTLCSGVEMMGAALRHLYGPLEVRWHAEVDPDAAKVLAYHQPDVPNLGDITGGAPAGCDPDVMRKHARAKFETVEPVEVLVSTHPCQGNSTAGRRKGSADPRNLWPAAVGALDAFAARDQLPPVFLMENVPGLLTVDNGALFGQHLTDLDRHGYHTRWTTVGACKIGAPHHRHRVFLVATRRRGTRPRTWPALERDGDRWVGLAQDLFGGREESGAWPQAGEVLDGEFWPRPADPCGNHGIALLPTPAAGRFNETEDLDKWLARRAECRERHGNNGFGMPLGVAVRLLPTASPAPQASGAAVYPTPAARDWRSGESNIMDRNARPLNEVVVNLLPTPAARLADRGTPNAETAASRMETRRNLEDAIALLPTPKASDTGTAGRQPGEGWRPPLSAAILAAVPQPERWSIWADAVARWETMLRPAPEPTELGTRGQRQLNAEFASWMLGLPPGYVTGHVGRNAALKILGNGICWPSAALAFGLLLPELPTVGRATEVAA